MLLITFEGPEGGGRTAQIAILAEKLKQLNHEVLCTREPGGTPSADVIRNLILFPPDGIEFLPLTDVFLFQAARYDHVERVIRPALNSGCCVLCDRFSDSTRAYQSYGGNVPLALVNQLCGIATTDLWPDITFLLDLSVEQGLQRKTQQNETNRMEQADIEFHQRVRTGYLKLAKMEPERWVVIDATQSIEAIHQEILKNSVSQIGLIL